MKIYKPKEVAKMLNVTVNTLQRWDRSKVLIAFRFPNQRRYYTESQINAFLNNKEAI